MLLAKLNEKLIQITPDITLKNLHLIIPITLLFLFKLPSFFEKFWYIDEGIYVAVAEGLHQDKSLYSGVWDHKPPLIIWLFYIVSFLDWDIGLVVIRVIGFIIGVANIFLLAKILNKFHKRKSVKLISLCLYAFLIGTPIFEGNTVNAEIIFSLFNLLIIYAFLYKKNYYIIGSLLFLSFITKFPGFLEAGFIIMLFGLIHIKAKGVKYIITNYIKILIPFTVLISIMLTYFFINSNLYDFFYTNFLYNFKYSNTSSSDTLILGFSFNQTILSLILLTSLLTVATISYFKNQISKQVLFITFIFSIELFASTISGRNYPHYLIQITPGLTFITAFFLSKVNKNNLLKSFIYILAPLIILHVAILGFTKGEPLALNTKPQFYYPRFPNYILSEDKNSANFTWATGNTVTRIKTLSQHINKHYPEEKTYYLYTEVPWAFVLIEKEFTNKYVTYIHLLDNIDFQNEAKENMRRADLVIIDTTVPQIDPLAKQVAEYQFVREVIGYNIYHSPPSNS